MNELFANFFFPQILEASKFQKAVKAGRVPEGCTYTYDKVCVDNLTSHNVPHTIAYEL
jgi:hypothetical protein